MSSPLICFLGVSVLVLGVSFASTDPDPCNTKPEITLSQMEGVYYLQKLIPLDSSFTLKCANYTIALESKTKGTITFATVDSSTGKQYNDIVSSVTQDELTKVITAKYVGEGSILESTITVLYDNEDGAVVEQNRQNDKNVIVLSYKQVISEEKVAALLKGACIPENTPSTSVDQTKC